jgi:transcriptional regulator
MYSPKHYDTLNDEIILRIIRENQFATLICGDQVSHLPLLLGRGDRLIGHMARANPQWKSFPANTLSIFQGPHGYISPAWYNEATDNVPTWNYVAVHVKGQARIIESVDAVFETMQTLVKTNEEFYGTGWKLERNADLEKLSRAIVAFEITDLEFQGKLKLSQKIAPDEHARVVENLEKLGNNSLAEWMRFTKPSQVLK